MEHVNDALKYTCKVKELIKVFLLEYDEVDLEDGLDLTPLHLAVELLEKSEELLADKL